MFPTPVGMNRRSGGPGLISGNVPHTRGDEPIDGQLVKTYQECSPHPWG